MTRKNRSNAVSSDQQQVRAQEPSDYEQQARVGLGTGDWWCDTDDQRCWTACCTTASLSFSGIDTHDFWSSCIAKKVQENVLTFGGQIRVRLTDKRHRPSRVQLIASYRKGIIVFKRALRWLLRSTLGSSRVRLRQLQFGGQNPRSQAEQQCGLNLHHLSNRKGNLISSS